MYPCCVWHTVVTLLVGVDGQQGAYKVGCRQYPREARLLKEDRGRGRELAGCSGTLPIYLHFTKHFICLLVGGVNAGACVWSVLAALCQRRRSQAWKGHREAGGPRRPEGKWGLCFRGQERPFLRLLRGRPLVHPRPDPDLA